MRPLCPQIQKKKIDELRVGFVLTLPLGLVCPVATEEKEEDDDEEEEEKKMIIDHDRLRVHIFRGGFSLWGGLG